MAEIVNLRAVRKARARAAAQVSADANRAAFGQTKEARRAAREETDRRARLLDGARLERD